MTPRIESSTEKRFAVCPSLGAFAAFIDAKHLPTTVSDKLLESLLASIDAELSTKTIQKN
jgi:hypothetical protein